MLNRRILRVKVMQAIYALKQSEGADYQLGMDHIATTFSPDLNAAEVQDKNLLKIKKERATQLFEQKFSDKKIDESKEEADVFSAVEKALKFYKDNISSDKKHYEKLMMADIDKIYEEYISILILLLDFAAYSESDDNRISNKYLKSEDGGNMSAQNIRKNRVIQILSSLSLESKIKKRSLVFEQAFVKEMYRDVLRKDQNYLDYLSVKGPDAESDRTIVLHIFKTLIFKSEKFNLFLDEFDINWTENKDIVKNMVLKTIKNIDFESQDKEVLLGITLNWEEDKEYFLELFKKTASGDKKLEGIIKAKVTNWDIERVTLIDRIILMMAICEMIQFPNIPVKVTINEFIEVSKSYSTPKSKQFINGVLDSIAIQLTEEGVIKKSGRGLIDNK